jgi:cytochrome c oxidase subunit 4
MSEHAHAKHRPSTRDYFLIFAALAVMTTITVLVAYSSLGEGVKTTLAFVIATIKAILVALIFMHLRFEKRPIVIFAIAPVLIALLFIVAIAPDIGK